VLLSWAWRALALGLSTLLLVHSPKRACVLADVIAASREGEGSLVMPSWYSESVSVYGLCCVILAPTPALLFQKGWVELDRKQKKEHGRCG
jgi:hypothetical protein